MKIFLHTHTPTRLHSYKSTVSLFFSLVAISSFVSHSRLTIICKCPIKEHSMHVVLNEISCFIWKRERKEGNWCLLTCKQKHARWKIKNKWRLFYYDHRTYFYIKSFSVRIQFNFDVYSTKGKLLNYTCHFYYIFLSFDENKGMYRFKWHLPNPYYYYLSMMIKNHLS